MVKKNHEVEACFEQSCFSLVDSHFFLDPRATVKRHITRLRIEAITAANQGLSMLFLA